MKNYFLSLFCVLNVSLTCYAQLSGFAYLSGQTNHSNITVKFLAVSPSAVTDSAFTAADGSYSINITGGVYQVIFSKSNYQSIYYNAANALALTNTVVINTQTLVPGNFYGVSGIVSGTWNSNSTYLVTGNCTVTLGSTLTIQPGAIIKFNGNYSLTIKGVLSAIGSPFNKIIFTSAQINPKASDWKGIYTENNACVLKECLIEYAFIGFNGTAGTHTIENCEFKNSVYGVYLLNDNNSLLKNNLIWHLLDTYYSSGIIIEGQSSTRVECNTLHTISGTGIRAMSGVNIKNNHVYNITKTLSPNYGWGIWSDYYASGTIENNYVHHCECGVSVGDSPSGASIPINPTIVNNVLTNNTTGIQYISEAKGTIVNNIISDNQTGILNFLWATPTSISNNLFWNNSTTHFNNVSVAGIGLITGSNSAGHAIDSYNNLFQDPFIVSGSPYYGPNSPCINSGKSAYSNNIGMNANTVCQGMIMGIESQESAISALDAFPNPFTSVLTLSRLGSERISSARFYDLSGKMYEAHFEMNQQSQVLIKAEVLSKGVYFLEIVYTNSSKEYLRVIKE